MRQVRTRCSFLPQFVTFVVLVLTCPMGHADEASQVKTKELDPNQIWSSLLTDRQTLTSGECDVRVDVIHAASSEVVEQLTGATLNYHLIWDHERFRIDLTETRPKNPEDVNDYRTSFFDGISRCIPQYNLHNVAAYEDTVKSHELLKPLTHLRGHGWIDPRIAGIWPSSFADLGKLTFDELRSFPPLLKGAEANFEVHDGVEMIRLKWVYQKNNALREFLLDPSLNFAPREVTMLVSPPDGIAFRDTISCQWRVQEIPDGSTGLNCVLPQTVIYQRHFGDKLVWHEKSLFSFTKPLNKPIDEAVFGWPALGLRAGAVVIQTSETGDRKTVAWNGKSMEKWKPLPLTLNGLKANNPTLESANLPPQPTTSQSRRMLFWVNVVVALACLAYFLLKRVQTQSGSRE